MGLLLRVSQEDQVLAWVRMYTGALHGPGKDAAGNQHPTLPLDSCFSRWFPGITFLSHWQVVTFFHTVLLSDNLTFRTALVVCPLNTVLNWVYEFRKWQRNVGSDRVNVCTAVYMKAERFTPNGDTNLVWQVRHLVAVNPSERLAALQKWYREGGVMVMGYELYRILSLAPKTNNEASRRELKRVLVDPGGITQEGHHLTQVWSRLSFHTLCFVCPFRSGLCGV